MLRRLSLWTLLAALVLAAPKDVPAGFLTTSGRDFVLEGKKFAFVGANSYWLPLLTTEEDVTRTFDGLKAAGVKVLRTWGFNAINQSELDGAVQSGLTYYQVWNGTDWTLNDGPQGLQRFDRVVKTAEKYGIKLIVPFTNNWVGYGGMDLYVSWIKGPAATHDAFYTDQTISDSYQRYAKIIVERYKDSPAIGAWELANEARCLGEIGAGPNCIAKNALLTKWYRKQSDFIRSLDPYHLITTGGEGHFYWDDPPTLTVDGVTSPDYNYDGRAGESFDDDLALPNIDFGTYHIYAQYWYGSLDHPGTGFSIEQWGLGWIQQHIDAANKLNKPTVLEEFGLMGYQNQTTIYPTWVKKALDTDHGIMPWQFGQLGLTENGGNRVLKYADYLIDGASPNDGFAIYPNLTAIYTIFTDAAKVQEERSGQAI